MDRGDERPTMTGRAIHGPSGNRPPQPVPEERMLRVVLAGIGIAAGLVILLTYPVHALIASVVFGGIYAGTHQDTPINHARPAVLASLRRLIRGIRPVF